MSVKVSFRKLAQPSTWAGFGLLWTAFGPGHVPWDIVVNAAIAVCALLAVVLDERPSD